MLSVFGLFLEGGVPTGKLRWLNQKAVLLFVFQLRG